MLLTALLLFFATSPQAPTDPGTLFTRAVGEQQAGNDAAAVRDYRRFLTFQPHSVEAHANLGAALVHQAHYDEGIKEYRAALASMPPDAPEAAALRLNIALAYFKQGALPQARTELTALHQADPQNPRIATLLGDTLTRLDQPQAAVDLLAPLQPANSSDPDFTFVFASALVRADHRRPGADLAEELAKGTNSAEAYALAGQTLLDLYEFDRARADLEAALKLNPALPGLWTSVGVARDMARDADGSLDAFHHALAENPNDFTANLYLGAILLKARDLPGAHTYLAKALALQPNSPMARYQEALEKSANNDPAGAVAELEPLVQAQPDWLEPHLQLSTLYYRVHQPDKGAAERATVQRLTAAQQASGPKVPTP